MHNLNSLVNIIVPWNVLLFSIPVQRLFFHIELSLFILQHIQ